VNEDKRAEEEAAIAAIDGVQPQSERMLEAQSAQNAAGEVETAERLLVVGAGRVKFDLGPFLRPASDEESAGGVSAAAASRVRDDDDGDDEVDDDDDAAPSAQHLQAPAAAGREVAPFRPKVPKKQAHSKKEFASLKQKQQSKWHKAEKAGKKG